MKTFTATQLNKSPQDIFDAAKEDGSALIEHSRYRKGVFAIAWNPDVVTMPEAGDITTFTHGNDYECVSTKGGEA